MKPEKPALHLFFIRSTSASSKLLDQLFLAIAANGGLPAQQEFFTGVYGVAACAARNLRAAFCSRVGKTSELCRKSGFFHNAGTKPRCLEKTHGLASLWSTQGVDHATKSIYRRFYKSSAGAPRSVPAMVIILRGGSNLCCRPPERAAAEKQGPRRAASSAARRPADRSARR